MGEIQQFFKNDPFSKRLGVIPILRDLQHYDMRLFNFYEKIYNTNYGSGNDINFMLSEGTNNQIDYERKYGIIEDFIFIVSAWAASHGYRVRSY